MSTAKVTMRSITDKLANMALRSRVQIVVLSGITMLAALLRFYRLGQWSFWIDEIFTINRAIRHVNLEAIIAAWWHPSVSLILTNSALETLGVSEWSARLVPALIGIVTIPILYLPIRRLFGPAAALLSVLLLAVSPWHLEWSQNARYYTSMMLLYFIASFAFFQAFERDKPWYLLFSGVMLMLAIAERFIAVFLVPVVLAYILVLSLSQFEKPVGYRKRNLAIILGPGIAFSLWETGRFLLTGNSYLLGATQLSYSLPIDDPFRLASYIAYDIGIPLLCLAIFSSFFLLAKRSREGLFFSLNAMVPVILLLIINPFYFTKARYVFMTLPFWLVLAGVAIRELSTQTKGNRGILVAGILALLLADAAGDNFLYYSVNHGNRLDWRGAFSLVREQSQPEDAYVTWWPELGDYYLGRQMMPWQDVDPEFVTNGGRRVWFILDDETVWANTTMKAWVEKNAELIEVSYLRRPADAYLRIYRYDPGSNTGIGEAK